MHKKGCVMCYCVFGCSFVENESVELGLQSRFVLFKFQVSRINLKSSNPAINTIIKSNISCSFLRRER